MTENMLTINKKRMKMSKSSIKIRKSKQDNCQKDKDKDKKTNKDIQNTSQKTKDRAILVTNPAISHERGTDREVLIVRVEYPGYIATKIFRNGEASHRVNRKTFQVMLNH